MRSRRSGRMTRASRRSRTRSRTSARQLLRAVLLAGRKPVGLPVYFTVSPARRRTVRPPVVSPSPSRDCGSPTWTMPRADGSSKAAGLLDPAGQHAGHFSSTKRVIFDANPGQNVATLTMTVFVLGGSPPENLTLQGAHDFNTGGQVGSVSAASARYARFIGQRFEVRDGRLVIGRP